MTTEPVRTALSHGPCPSFPKLAARYLEEYPGSRFGWHPQRLHPQSRGAIRTGCTRRALVAYTLVLVAPR